jgi:hypothetical protein
MKPKSLKLLERCIEDGVASGLHRAYKRSDTVSREQIQQSIEDAILHEVHEWFDFDQEDAT